MDIKYHINRNDFWKNYILKALTYKNQCLVYSDKCNKNNRIFDYIMIGLLFATVTMNICAIFFQSLTVVSLVLASVTTVFEVLKEFTSLFKVSNANLLTIQNIGKDFGLIYIQLIDIWTKHSNEDDTFIVDSKIAVELTNKEILLNESIISMSKQEDKEVQSRTEREIKAYL